MTRQPSANGARKALEKKVIDLGIDRHLRATLQPCVTVGRLVYFYNNAGHELAELQAVAAIVTEVTLPTVSLTLFPPGLPPVPAEGIHFCTVPTAGCWGWPPRI